MNLAIIESIIGIAIFSGTSVLYAVLGGIVIERAGIITIGIEGILMISAVFSTAVAVELQDPILGIFAGICAGAVLGLVQAFGTITMRSDHVIVGFAIFIFGDGMAKILGSILGPNGRTLVGVVVPKLEKLDLGIPLLSQDVLVLFLIPLTITLWLYFYRTRMGLVHKAVGEDPYAADIQGINVLKVKYIATVVGCSIIGIGGAHLALSFGTGWNDFLSNGRGWIAVAIIVFSGWNPLFAVVGVLLYGITVALQFRLQMAGFGASIHVLKAMPYFVTLAAVTLLSQRRNGAPKALGKSFKRE